MNSNTIHTISLISQSDNNHRNQKIAKLVIGTALTVYFIYFVAFRSVIHHWQWWLVHCYMLSVTSNQLMLNGSRWLTVANTKFLVCFFLSRTGTTFHCHSLTTNMYNAMEWSEWFTRNCHNVPHLEINILLFLFLFICWLSPSIRKTLFLNKNHIRIWLKTKSKIINWNERRCIECLECAERRV